MTQLTVNGSRPGTSYQPRHSRRVLCVFPRYAHSFGTFQYAYSLMPDVQAFMPPQGILLIAAYMPAQWDVRFVDENIQQVSDADLQWADVVFISGMHVQKHSIHRINDDAHRLGKLTVLGGPSVSGCPEYYPDVDILHVGEIGNATDELVALLDHDVSRPGEQLRLETTDRHELHDFPTPAYHLLDMRNYFLGSIQYSSGCPFLCEFCDIPALYGRNPRIKHPEQVVAELDQMLNSGIRGAIYFVDDNFVANPAATRELLPHLIKWQQRTGYRIRFSCEATLNLAQMPDILAMMHEANFVACFVGIETPNPEALTHIQKKQNMRQPILDSIKTFNDHGIEVVSGIILGLDTDTPETGQHILDFIEASQIPMLTINLLYALPRTRLYDRLEAEHRLTDDPSRESNVIFKMPYDDVLAMWRNVVETAYAPDNLFERFRSQTEICFPNRLKPPNRSANVDLIAFGIRVIGRTLWQAGVRADYRKKYWSVAGPLIKTGRIEDAVHVGLVTHHLISYTRDCMHGNAEASFYNDPNRARTSEPAHETITSQA